MQIATAFSAMVAICCMQFRQGEVTDADDVINIGDISLLVDYDQIVFVASYLFTQRLPLIIDTAERFAVRLRLQFIPESYFASCVGPNRQRQQDDDSGSAAESSAGGSVTRSHTLGTLRIQVRRYGHRNA